jgi:hypothetical protein
VQEEPQKPSNQIFIKEKEDLFIPVSNNNLVNGFSTKIKLVAEPAVPWQQKGKLHIHYVKLLNSIFFSLLTYNNFLG